MAWYNENDEAIIVNTFQNNFLINGTPIGHFLKSYSVNKIKQVCNGETNSAGQVLYDKIPGWTYKINLEFNMMTQTQLSGIASLLDGFEVNVSFYNPFTGQMINNYAMYPNDQTSSLMYHYAQGSGTRILYNNMSLNLIGISPIV